MSTKTEIREAAYDVALEALTSAKRASGVGFDADAEAAKKLVETASEAMSIAEYYAKDEESK